MTNDFDHYYKWLGIPPEDQPPNHYQLLGLRNFTEDHEVIANAADQRAMHLRMFQLGKYADIAQETLNEVLRASTCLLNAEKKLAYDAELRVLLAVSLERLAEPPSVIDPVEDVETGVAIEDSPVMPGVFQVFSDSSVKRESVGIVSSSLHEKKRRKSKSANPLVEVAKIIAGGIAGTVLAYFLVCWISPDNDFLGLRKPKPSQQVATRGATIPLESSIAAPPASVAPTTVVKEHSVNTADDSKQQSSAPDEPPTEEPPRSSTSLPVVEGSNEPATPIESDEQRLQRLTAERDAALAKSDLAGASDAVEAIAEMTGGDALDQKLAIVARVLDAAETPSESQRATESMLRLLHECADEKRKRLDDRYADLLITGARQSGSDDLIRWCTLCVLKIQEK